MRTLPFLIALCLAPSAFAGDPPPPGPDKPLQTQNTKADPAWLLQGWTANILGTAADPGQTWLVVEGEEGYKVTANIDGKDVEQMSPAKFQLEQKDYRIVVKVLEPRGADWSETVDVPKGMKVTVQVKARYEHRGFEGTIKNDTAACKKKSDRKWYRFEVFQGDKAIGNFIDLEPGKSAPGVLLKIGTYDLKISERGGAAGWTPVKTEKLEVKEQQWRYELGCP
ncbi:MAG: hypothetical protein U1F43_12070 [Myxococcota bacterium]